MIELTQDKFYGNYRGQVVETADASKLGRIRVRVLPMFSGAAVADIPWAVPAMPLFCGAASGAGAMCIPEVGSWVWCFFEQGEFMQPVYFAEAGNGATGVPDQTSYPKRRALVSAKGSKIVFDDTTGDVILSHHAGSTITLKESGEVVVVAAGPLTMQSSGLVHITGATGVKLN